MTRVLLTGATGFVGQHILQALCRIPEVKVVPVIREVKEPLMASSPSVERVVVTTDLFSESEAWWAEQCRDIDVVVHVAWYAEPGRYLQACQNMDCLIGSLNLVKGAVVAGVGRFVGIGTCFEYDLENGVASLSTPLKPLTPYASAKAALFLSLSQWLPAQSVQFAWCRLFYLYGEGEDERRLVPYIRKQIENGKSAELTSGKQIRDFLDVAEAGKMIADIALSNCEGPFNVCSGIPITVRELAERVADEYGRRDLLMFGARPDNLIDPPCVLGIPTSK
ncbi:NAD(P)-dependent oxidoreductase [Halomonas sp. 707B3]|uniref:NAD-dependent epimerase/dehydratase family protein n=1 Tax=Halomonas sp. 707B3 TaxID=1681043 RepID=UPI0020A02615|nr:NAD(P)-dependent oxidoreductase [Halomonas sp. 707B3]MCP1316176.1 NAD(P)-dependent oxidoreductase [Halomonas sp. 707B3]